MLQEQIFLYIRENTLLTAVWSGFAVVVLLLLVLIQVTRTKREVHKICKKVQRYFEVILTEEVQEPVAAEEEPVLEMPVPVSQTAEEIKLQEEEKIRETEELRILMDVISEVF